MTDMQVDHMRRVQPLDTLEGRYLLSGFGAILEIVPALPAVQAPAGEFRVHMPQLPAMAALRAQATPFECEISPGVSIQDVPVEGAQLYPMFNRGHLGPRIQAKFAPEGNEPVEGRITIAVTANAEFSPAGFWGAGGVMIITVGHVEAPKFASTQTESRVAPASLHGSSTVTPMDIDRESSPRMMYRLKEAARSAAATQEAITSQAAVRPAAVPQDTVNPPPASLVAPVLAKSVLAAIPMTRENVKDVLSNSPGATASAIAAAGAPTASTGMFSEVMIADAGRMMPLASMNAVTDVPASSVLEFLAPAMHAIQPAGGDVAANSAQPLASAANSIQAAATHLFYFARIDPAVLADAIWSMTDEIFLAPGELPLADLADAGPRRAWAVTAAVAALDLCFAGWLWWRNVQRKRMLAALAHSTPGVLH